MNNNVNVFENIVIRTMAEDLANAKRNVSSTRDIVKKMEIPVPLLPKKNDIASITKNLDISSPKPIFSAKVENNLETGKEKNFVNTYEIKKIIPFYEKSAFRMLIIIVLLLSLTLIGKVVYDKLNPVIVEVKPVEQNVLFSADEELKIFGNDSIKNQKQIAGMTFASSSIVRLVYYEDGVNPINREKALAQFGISIPEQVKSSLEEDYNLFISLDETNPNSRYNLGFVFKVHETDLLENSLLDWSKNSMVNDLSKLYLMNSAQDEENEEVSFSGVNYKGIDIYFANLPDIYATVDYAILKDKKYLIITSTKDAMLSAIDKIIPEGDTNLVPIQKKIEKNENIENKESSEVSLEETLNSKQVLFLFGGKLKDANIDEAMQYVEESKKESILAYLRSMGNEKLVELGNKILSDISVVYEKEDISLYELNCNFIDLEKVCNFYLSKNSSSDEWLLVQM